MVAGYLFFEHRRELAREEKQTQLVAEAQKPLDDKLEKILAMTAREKGVEMAPELSIRIIKDFQDRKIGNETIINFLKRGDLKIASDPEILYANFLALAERYVALERRATDITASGKASKSNEVVSLGASSTTALNSGDIDKAELLVKAAELQQKLLNDIRYSVTDGGGLVFKDGWDQANIISVDIPQIRGVSPLGDSPHIPFYKNGADQLRAAFKEVDSAGLRAELREWCGSYRPRLLRGSTSAPSNHALGLSFDLNCTKLQVGKSINLSGQLEFARVIEIFQKHGFIWGGWFKRQTQCIFNSIALARRKAEAGNQHRFIGSTSCITTGVAELV